MSIISLLEDAKLSPTLLFDRGEYIKAVRQGISGAILSEAIAALSQCNSNLLFQEILINC